MCLRLLANWQLEVMPALPGSWALYVLILIANFALTKHQRTMHLFQVLTVLLPAADFWIRPPVMCSAWWLKPCLTSLCSSSSPCCVRFSRCRADWLWPWWLGISEGENALDWLNDAFSWQMVLWSQAGLLAATKYPSLSLRRHESWGTKQFSG